MNGSIKRISETDLALISKNQEIAALESRISALDKWRLALEGLTPNGSEFVNDLDRCLAFIREKEQSQMRAIRDFKRRADLAEARIAATSTGTSESGAIPDSPET